MKAFRKEDKFKEEKPKKEPVICKTCKGTGKIWYEEFVIDHKENGYKPCPDCKVEE